MVPVLYIYEETKESQDMTLHQEVSEVHTHTLGSRWWTQSRVRHITHRERRMLQFWARRPSITESSLTFLELNTSSSVSFCSQKGDTFHSRTIRIQIKESIHSEF